MPDWRVYRWDELLDRLRKLPSIEVQGICSELEVRYRRMEDERDEATALVARLQRDLADARDLA